VDASENEKYNLDFGYKSGFTWYSLNGIEVTGKNQTTGALETFTGGNLYTYMDYGHLTIGLSRSRYSNVTIRLKDGSLRTNKSFSRLYGGLLISTRMNFEDILGEVGKQDNGKPLYSQYSIDEYLDKGPVGFKLGYSADFLNNFLAGFTVETGSIPGIGGIGHNFYFSVMTRIGMTKIFK
jgi:hypothetical protein